MGAAGVAAGGPLYVDDVFSTYLYDGSGGTQSINNGIDLAGEGGLVWIKNRKVGWAHVLTDTERGAPKVLYSNAASQQATGTTQGVNAFNSNGFSLTGTGGYNNTSGNNYVSWTFRKAPGFFDVVTYTGNDTSGRAIAHDLGSVPGMIIVKKTSGTDNWQVWHRSMSTGNLSSNDLLKLDQSGGKVNRNSYIGTANSSTFEVGTDSGVNTSGATYVAYIFAHDDASFGTDEDESIIKCGTFTTSSSKATVNLGFEPQWVMFKGYSGSSPGNGWEIYNSMTGLAHGSYTRLSANDIGAEVSGAVPVCSATATGFEIENTNNTTNFIYMAIRRPNKPPTAATEVFNPAIQVGTVPNFASSFPVDFGIRLLTGGGNTTYSQTFISRLTGEGYMPSSQTNQEATGSFASWDRMNGWGDLGGSGYGYSFKRAPGFMDVVAYKGTGSNSAGTQQVVNHNLEVAPELVIVKNRDYAKAFFVWSSHMTEKYRMALNDTAQELSGGDTYWQANNTFTATQFGLGYGVNTNRSPDKHIAYLFASLAGISKIGTYSGNTGNAVNVNCGFSSGARFVLIKRTDAEVTGTYASGWYVWDTVRGIVSGNDPYILLNTTAAQVTNTDYIDPLGTGFTVTSSAPAALNASGGTYLFLAIA